MDERLELLCDLATEAHERVQENHADIDPIVGVHQKMRDAGFPVDMMTIDCLKNGKRIIVLLHDDQPSVLQYQFSYREQDPAEQFEELAFESVTATTLYEWMRDYFGEPVS